MIRFNGRLTNDEEAYWNDRIGCTLDDELLDSPDNTLLLIFEDRLPPWTALQDPDRCVKALKGLVLMTRDGYDHVLPPLPQDILYRTLLSWKHQMEENLAEPELSGDELTAYEKEALEDLGKLNELIKKAFSDMPILKLEAITRLEGTSSDQGQMDLSDYKDLLPEDVWVRWHQDT